MDWNLPLSIDGAAGKSLTWRLKMFLGHFDARVFLTETAFVDVGAGSLDCELRVNMVRDSFSGRLGTIGRFCAVGSCDIMAFGEHANDRPLNMGLSGTPLFNSMLAQNGSRWALETGPFFVGSGTVISNGAKVLPGRRIGVGSVVGAGAIVAKDIGDYGIYGGVPARLLKGRNRFAPWWDFHPAYMAELLAENALDAAAERSDGHRYWEHRPRLVYRRDANKELNLLGVVDGEQIAPIAEQPDAVRQYIAQAMGDGPYVWWSDPWST